jgi:GNAT superfamily N-acetyltransferase
VSEPLVTPALAAAAPVTVHPVASRADLEAFIRLPWRLYAGDPCWVPPLLAEQRALFDRARHPFHRHATVQLFLARCEGQIVGRIAAIDNAQHTRTYGDGVGFFGFFESVHAPPVAQALLAAAANWLAARGLRAMRGPMNFSTNEECGLLVEGFDRPPVFMMTYNPPFYADLVAAAGLRKAKDLLAYLGRREQLGQRQKFARVVERVRQRHDLRVRHADLRRFAAEVAVLKRVYNVAWRENWGFVPMTDEELDYLARRLRAIVVPELALVAEVGGEPVGVSIALPDYNEVLRHLNGRLWPFGFLKALWYRRRIKRLRLVTLGVVPGYRKAGVDVVLVWETIERALRLGYEEAEFSWILEDNTVLNNTFVQWGVPPYKRYRIYERALVDRA